MKIAAREASREVRRSKGRIETPRVRSSAILETAVGEGEVRVLGRRSTVREEEGEERARRMERPRVPAPRTRMEVLDMVGWMVLGGGGF